MPEQTRSRGEKIWDGIVTGGAGTFAATLMVGICIGAWNMYNSVQRLETMQKAMNIVITDKLARVDINRMHKLEHRLNLLEKKSAAECKKLEETIEGILTALLEEDQEAVKRMLAERSKPKSGDPEQPQGQDQNQDPVPEPNAPIDWNEYESIKKGIQEQIQQQQELLK